MTVQTFYQCAIWLPLLFPALIAFALHGLGLQLSDTPLEEPLRMLLISGIYGGVPYAALATWATWWIDERPEREIRRLALRAPLYMLAAWAVVAVVFGVLARKALMFLGLLGLGGLFTLVLGYAYVGLVFMLRAGAERAGMLSETSNQAHPTTS